MTPTEQRDALVREMNEQADRLRCEVDGSEEWVRCIAARLAALPLGVDPEQVRSLADEMYEFDHDVPLKERVDACASWVDRLRALVPAKAAALEHARAGLAELAALTGANQQPPEWRYQRQPFMPPQPLPARTTEPSRGEQDEDLVPRLLLNKALDDREAERLRVRKLKADIAQARKERDEAKLAEAEARAEWHPTSLRAAWEKCKQTEAKLAEARADEEKLSKMCELWEALVKERDAKLAEARADVALQQQAGAEHKKRAQAAEAKLAEVRRENSTMRVRLDALEANQRDDEAKLARVAELVEHLASDVEHARAAIGPPRGMSVPWHGRFASCVMVPSAVKDLESLVRDLRAALAPEGGS